MIQNGVGNLLISPNASGKSIKLIGGLWTGTIGLTIEDGGAASFGSNAVSMGALTATSGIFNGSVGIQNTISAYNGDNTAGNGVASVVGYTPQIGIGSSGTAYTTICTPATTGVYEINAYAVVTTAATAGTVSFAIQYTDPDLNAGRVTYTAGISSTNSNVQTSFSLTSTQVINLFPVSLRVKGGTAVQLNSVVGGVSGSPVYNLYSYTKRII